MDALTEPEPSPGSGRDSSTGSTVLDDRFPVEFWLAYAANVAVVTGNALSFRFAEQVGFLGGRESTAGLIIAIATASSLLIRIFLGQSIDRYGVRRLWLASSLVYVAGGGLLAIADSIAQLHVARSLFAIGIAGVFTCSNVHVQGIVAPYRRTEAIGTLGSGGFLGMFLGTAVGDVIFHQFSGGLRFNVLFGTATVLGLIHVGLILAVTRRDRHVPPAETPAMHRLLKQNWPGNVMLIALAMGLMFAVTTVFLTRFATHRGLSGLGPFFASYAISAFAFRLGSRNWSRRVGRHRMILWGMSGHVAAMAMLPFVTNEWMFVVPALSAGFGHALLFPSVVSLGAEAFPREYRGTGTTIVMGFIDVGTFVSAPVLGGIIDAGGGSNFTAMFAVAATAGAIVAILYRRTAATCPDSELTWAASTVRSCAEPLISRHSPIEPLARNTIGASIAVRDDSVVVPARTAAARQNAVALPATRCR